MGHLIRWGAALLLIWTHTLASPTLLLIDRSGSMKGSDSVVEKLFRGIRVAAGGQIDLAAFSTKAHTVGSFEQVLRTPFGQFTYLDRALDFALKEGRYSVVWIVTDNMQSEVTDPEAPNTEVFYERLKEDVVARITIFPVLQRGRPGLVVYCLQIHGSDDDYRAQVDGLNEGASDLGLELEALIMKPLDRETIELDLIRDPALEESEPSRYREGDHIRESLELRFRSKFKHLIIENAVITDENSRADFGEDSLLQNKRSEVVVTPKEVHNLRPQDLSRLYTVDFDLGQVTIKPGLSSYWKAAFGRSVEDRVLTLSLKIRVPQKNFKFRPDFLKRYAAANPKDAKRSGKVYGVEKLPLLLGEESTLIVSERKFPIRIDYPWYPAFIFVAAFALAAVAVGAGLKWLLPPILAIFSRSRWTVTASRSNRPIDSSISPNGQVTVDGRVVGLVNDDRFSPHAGVSIESPATSDGTVALRSSSKVTIRKGHGLVSSLIFTTDQKAASVPKNIPRQPRRR